MTSATTAKPRPWWRRGVSLRALMVLILVIGGGLGGLVRHATVRQRAIDAIRRVGGRVIFADETSNSPPGGAWRWLYERTGIAYCREVDEVDYDPGWPIAVASTPPPGLSPVTEVFAGVGLLPETRSLLVSRCQITAAHLAELKGVRVELLRHEEIEGFTADALAELPRLTGVRTLLIGMAQGQEFPAATLTIIGRMPALQKLYIQSPMAALHGDDLAPLARLRDLELLSLERTPIDESCLRAVDDLRKLRALWVNRARVTDATLQRIATRHPDLVSIVVDGALLTDAGVEALAQLPKLVMVILRGDPVGGPGHLSDRSLAALGRVGTIRRLVLTCGRFTERGIDALQGLPLIRLGLDAVEPGSDAALARLLAGRALDWLTLGGPGITDATLPPLAGSLGRRSILDLSGSALTDAGLVHLAPLGISELVLNRTGLSDAGLANMAGAFRPGMLHVRGTRVTRAGIDVFHRVRPGVIQPEIPLDDD